MFGARYEPLRLTLLVVALAVAACSVGAIFLTHAHYTMWAELTADQLAPIHTRWYHDVVAGFIHPTSGLSAVLAVALLVFRHPRVPWWLLGLGAAVLAAVFATSMLMWARWQDQIGETDVLGRPYELIMDTHWLRITLVTAYAVVALSQVLAALLTRSRSADR